MKPEYPQWIMGVFYYNPDDTRLIVPIRGGRDHIFNYAYPIATVLTGASILLPLLGGLLMLGGFIRFFDLVVSNLFLIIVPTTVVLSAVAGIVANLFIREDLASTGNDPNAIEAPWDRATIRYK